MAHGFVCYNEDNVIQIDESSSCMQVVSKGTLTSWTSWTVWTPIKSAVITVPFSISDEVPLIAVYVPERSSTQISAGIEQMVGVLTGFYKNTVTSNWEFTLSIIGDQIDRTDPSPAVEWWAFAPPKVVPTTGFGLIIQKADGKIAYDSSKGILQIKNVLPTNSDASVSVPSGKKYAAFLNSYIIYDWSIDINVGYPGVIV